VGTRSPAGAERPAEQHFPVPVVYLHGLLAVTAVVLVLLTALGVGGSRAQSWSAAACSAGVSGAGTSWATQAGANSLR
jgi:hypothetical protein